jgi:hypothetical protein
LYKVGLDDYKALTLKWELVGGQAYYPERLAKAFVVHVPTIFWGVWHMLSPFIDKVTREKVGFLFMPDKQIFSAELWI